MNTPPSGILEYGKPIDLVTAKAVVASAEAEAVRNGWAVVVCVVDSTGHVVLLEKMDHAQYGSVEIARLKAETALNFKRPTKMFEDGVVEGGFGARFLSVRSVIALEGGILLLRDGRIIGTVGVSGAKASEDAQVARAGAEAISG
jgi:uncharacterized protein GlcG (DUF336 family)